MEYICTSCGRREVIIGPDTGHQCLICRKKMLRATESYEGLWFSPKFIFDRVQNIIARHGDECFQTGRFKKEREAWVTAMFALALGQAEGKQYWVEIEVVDETPDTKIHYMNQSTGNLVDDVLNVEVVDWEEHVADVMQLIHQKCQKAYPAYFCLLVFARTVAYVEPQPLIAEIQRLKVPFGEIWIAGRLGLSPRYAMAKLHPNYYHLEVDVPQALRNDRRQYDIARRMQRGTGIGFKPMGQAYLPIP